MSSFLLRTMLSPLKLSPESVSKIQVLLSPSLGSTASSGTSSPDSTPSAPFLPSSVLPALLQECPSLVGKAASYTPSPHLPTGHLQTIYSAGVDTVMEDVVHYRRRVVLLPDGGIISLDIAEAPGVEANEDTETVVILHGLTGGSHES